MNKITIVGAGRVGESSAQFIAAKNLCREIVLLDMNEAEQKMFDDSAALARKDLALLKAM